MANPMQISLYKQYMQAAFQYGVDNPYGAQAVENIRQLLIQCGPNDPDLAAAEREVVMAQMGTSTESFPRIHYGR